MATPLWAEPGRFVYERVGLEAHILVLLKTSFYSWLWLNDRTPLSQIYTYMVEKMNLWALVVIQQSR
ncbi:hypothetical protein XELAEV_18035583mg [Xenopus laevis]|uniref:Uncharacterized protein n=1 Tax=Xenopus laevis TaxID=8355 RepID=A0A974HCL1_XENLA|nr:hypothetical protein XELAEV_18035583mg [Xenopus laevis]